VHTYLCTYIHEFSARTNTHFADAIYVHKYERISVPGHDISLCVCAHRYMCIYVYVCARVITYIYSRIHSSNEWAFRGRHSLCVYSIISGGDFRYPGIQYMYSYIYMYMYMFIYIYMYMCLYMCDHHQWRRLPIPWYTIYVFRYIYVYVYVHMYIYM